MPGAGSSIRRDSGGSTRRPALVIALCFILGIALHTLVPPWPILWLVLLAVFGALAVIFFSSPRVSAAALILAIFLAGISLAQIEAFYYPPSDISAYATDDPRLAWLELSHQSMSRGFCPTTFQRASTAAAQAGC